MRRRNSVLLAVAAAACLLSGPASAQEDASKLRDLVVDLGAEEAHVRDEARERIVRIGAAAVPELVRTLDAKNPRARVEAARALGALGPLAREAVDALRKAVAGTDAALADAARSAIAEIERAQPSDPVVQRVEDLVAALVAKDRTARLTAIRRLGEVRNDDAARAMLALIPLLDDRDAEIRLASMASLGRLGPAAGGAAPRLTDLLVTQQGPIRAAALDALVRIGDPSAAPALRALARSHEAGDATGTATGNATGNVQPWLCAVAWDLGTTSVATARAALASDDVYLAAAGADFLGAVGSADPANVAALVGALTGRPALVRRRAAVALGAIGGAASEASVDPLVLLLADRESRAQTEAATALRQILADLAERPARPLRAPAETYEAMRAGLDWLARHQDKDGGFDCDGFEKLDPADDRSGGAGRGGCDDGVTAFAALAFARSGATGRGGADASSLDGSLRRVMRALVSIQDAEGCFGDRKQKTFMYGTAIATLAACEAARATRHPLWRASAQRGLDFLAAARNPVGCWRYEVRAGDTDTSVNGWIVQAFRAGERAGLAVDRAGYPAVLTYLDSATDAKTGVAGYQAHMRDEARTDEAKKVYPVEKSVAMTASATLQRMLLGRTTRDDPVVALGLARIAELPPVWDVTGGGIDLYSWLSGTEAMFLAAGDPWPRWKTSLKEALLPSQQKAGAKAGSWDPTDPWGRDGGRIYSTAAAVLCLETSLGHMAPLPRDPTGEGRGLRAARALEAAAKDAANHEAVRAAARAALGGFGRP